VSKYIHPATIEAALQVASNLLPDDRREIEEGHGLDPMVELPLAVHSGSCVWFKVPNGKTAGMAGVGSNGEVWMLCTPAIHEYPITFAREAKRFIQSREEPLLWNIVDDRNVVHKKLLRFLGFKFLRKIFHGPNQLSFIEFCRVRSGSK
tara:strand:- start:210 stop:656 length:447 start_codon:yes stop_codon:yes gene_type:complete